MPSLYTATRYTHGFFSPGATDSFQESRHNIQIHSYIYLNLTNVVIKIHGFVGPNYTGQNDTDKRTIDSYIPKIKAGELSGFSKNTRC